MRQGKLNKVRYVSNLRELFEKSSTIVGISKFPFHLETSVANVVKLSTDVIYEFL
jgi:hypothetical protein